MSVTGFSPRKKRKPAVRVAEEVCEIRLRDYTTDTLPTTQCVRFEQFFDTRPTVAFQSPYRHPVEKFQTARGVCIKKSVRGPRSKGDAAFLPRVKDLCTRQECRVPFESTQHASSITSAGNLKIFDSRMCCTGAPNGSRVSKICSNRSHQEGERVSV